jgi:hypothetical protein
LWDVAEFYDRELKLIHFISHNEVVIASSQSMERARMNSRTYRYKVIDVFTDRPLKGNALAAFADAMVYLS